MQRKYNNPFLEISHLKDELKRFIEHTSPKQNGGIMKFLNNA